MTTFKLDHVTSRLFSGEADLAEVAFEDAATYVSGLLRTAFSDALDGLGVSSDRPQTLVELLKIDLNLARKICSLCSVDDLFASAQYLPGRGGIRIFSSACRRVKIEESLLQAVSHATIMHTKLMEVHAGSRAALDSMLGHLAEGNSSERTDLALRRSAFHANASMLGVQTRCQTNTIIAFPSERENVLSVVRLHGFSELCRLCANRNWTVSRSQTVDTRADRTAPRRSRRPLDPEAAERHQGVPVLDTFTRGVVPEFRRREMPGGIVVEEIAQGPVGLRGAATFFVGDIIDELFAYDTPEGMRHLRFRTLAFTPSELTYIDFLFDRSLPFHGSPQYHLSTSRDTPATQDHDELSRITLPLCEQPVGIDPRSDDLTVPGFDDYPDVVRYAMQRIGADPGRFAMWRTAIRYPPIYAHQTLEWFITEN